MDPVFAGSLIAAVFALATLILIWNLYLGAQLNVRALLTLCLAAFFPGHVYEHAVFPVSIFAFFQSASLYAWATKRFAWAGVLGGIAAFSYGSGLFLAGVLGLDLLFDIRNQKLAEFVRRVVVGPGLIVGGFAVAAWVQWLDAGVWNGYFAVQGKYHYKPTPPWQSLEPHISYVLSGHPTAPHVQSVFVIILMAVLVWAAARLPREKTDRVLAIFLLAYWIIPLSLGGNLSVYRAEAVLLPGAPLANKLPRTVIVGLLLPAVVISFRMAILFFKNVLV
jgi:hypothetical protein